MPSGTRPLRKSTPASRAVEKSVAILDHLRHQQCALSLAEIALFAGLGKASTLRILIALERCGCVSKDDARRYRLNENWARDGDGAEQVRAPALAEMRQLSAQFAETVTLAILDRDLIRVVEVIETPHTIRIANYKGRILPPYASALGKAITAYQDPIRMAQLIHTYGIYRFTGNTIVDLDLIQNDLASVREQGFAIDNEETVVGGYCMASPVFSSTGEVRAAFSISQPIHRLTAERRKLIPMALKEAAMRVQNTFAAPLKQLA